jgi:GMP synthase (glutamine-hydrolysing)
MTSTDYIRHETDWMAVPLKENKPLLGICLGAQMLVNHLGGKVESHPEGLVEIGWYPIRPTEEGKALMDWPEMIYQFHREGFTLPSGAVHLVTGDTYENQAFRYGDNAWGVQFHAELTQAMMQRWVCAARTGSPCPARSPARRICNGRMLYDRAVLQPGCRISSTWCFSATAASASRAGAGSARRAIAGTGRPSRGRPRWRRRRRRRPPAPAR